MEFSLDYEAFIKDHLDVSLNLSQNRKTPICRYFMLGKCFSGVNCAFRHAPPETMVVCKHWLRGLCKKGESCEFLHEYNLKRMPECYFFSQYGECTNSECLYLHLDPKAKSKECIFYSKGFCHLGPSCRNRHNRKVLCKRYLTGFCPFGVNCEFSHPKYDSLCIEFGGS